MLAVQLVASPASATGIYEMPSSPPQTQLLDQADVISRLNEGKITKELEDLSQQTGNEVHLVVIRRLDYDESPEGFTNKLFEKWFPTPEAQANQTLLVLDKVTNQAAIRTGDQVKAVMSDAIATSMAQETLLVPLVQGDNYNQAFLDVSDRLVAVLSGRPDPGPPQVVDNVRVEGTFATAEKTEQERGNSLVWVVGLLVAATVIPMATYYFYLFLQSRA
ncbi:MULTISPECIES: photosystem II repair protein Psb32 [Trichocoleus]|uniref:TPM domain-containing protein n=1 Tax=Trichocoleus desertorum GB2-A4 TaxID=2933944 RepID=A0ABV0JC74_9CYAN|nr:TPM domain-containing protein [Trichocoleus sp. FACHB-46]